MKWIILEFGVVYGSRVFFMYVLGYLYIGIYIRKSMRLFGDRALISKSPYSPLDEQPDLTKAAHKICIIGTSQLK
jgi:hypothetical protein